MQTSSEDYGPRDLVGYGPNTPDPQWPNGAKIAISLVSASTRFAGHLDLSLGGQVLNYEEGSEHTPVNGDGVSETLASGKIGNPCRRMCSPAFFSELGPGVTPHIGQRDVNMESMYEYGSRAGVWRILRLFTQKKVHCTAYAVGQALEMNPQVGEALLAGGHEFSSHGWRWVDRSGWSEEEEEENVRKTIAAIKRASGIPPKGWYYGMVGSKASPRSRSLVARVFREEGIPLEYWCDDYSDDLPHWIAMPGGRADEGLLVIPYALDTNDYKNATYQAFISPDDFANYLIGAFDELYQEGLDGAPKMLSVGLHCRIVGRPARLAGLRKFIEYAQSKEGVWFARRDEISEHWKARFPYSA
ncbi:allantoinase, partial [Tremellales sp. Uapishka_1]